MKKYFFFSSIAILACIILACTGNSSATNNKTFSTTAAVSDATGGSGNDLFYEYKLTASSKEMNIQSNTKMYVSAKGELRSEMNMTNSFNENTTSVPIVTIGHADKPDESIFIDDSAKTFSINHFSDTAFNTGEKMNVKSVAKIDKEKILGFNSVHARVIVEKSIGGFYSDVDTIDIWRSNEVPFPALLKTLFDRFEAKTGNAMYPPAVTGQLKQLGCDGFMTKLEMHSKGTSMTEELIKVEHRDLPASMFTIPAGYTETKSDF